MSKGRVRMTIHTEKAARDFKRGAAKGVTLALEHLLTEANKHVPHDEGTLERSGRTVVQETSGRVEGAVYYDTPYAVRQHEDMTLNHHGKGESKWLENTMAAEAAKVGQVIATSIRSEVR